MYSLLFIPLFGAAIGSFLNVVIYRLPRRESLSFPPSHCPSCNTPIRYRDNIPIISYLLLKGSCRECHVRISPVYPVIEFVTACFALTLYLQNGLTLQLLSDFTLAAILLAAMMIDYRYMIIPDKLNASGALIAVIVALLQGIPEIFRSLLGAVTGAILMMVLFWLGKLLYKRDGVGFGDVKLAAVIGLFVGPFWCLLTCIISIILGGLWGIIQLTTKKKIGGQEIPFGPFLSCGGFFVLFFKRELLYLVNTYLSLF